VCPSELRVDWSHMSIRNMEKTHLNGRILGKPFLIPDFLNSMKEREGGEIPFLCKWCGKPPFILVAFANMN
jgi:hypothetical protein